MQKFKEKTELDEDFKFNDRQKVKFRIESKKVKETLSNEDLVEAEVYIENVTSGEDFEYDLNLAEVNNVC